MAASSICLAIDLGAGSGRVMAGLIDRGRMTLEEVWRFENRVNDEDGRLSWDFENLWNEVVEGIRAAVDRYGASAIRSIGVDTWGVDYGLVDREGNLLARPRCHRDSRIEGMTNWFLRKMSAEDLFQETGIQFLDINTLPQFCAEIADQSLAWQSAARFLMIPDLVNLRLSGRQVCERTNASTTQMYHPVSRTWSSRVFEVAGIPMKLAPEFVNPGQVLGVILPALASRTGLSPDTKVVVVGSHDTASAVAAVPAEEGKRFAYLSSGTWSLLGVELDAPVLSELARRYNLTNEVGVFDTIRLLKNINGMWIVQECRRVWREQGHDWDFQDLAEMSAKASPLQAMIDPDDPRFRGRCDMPEVIGAFCRESGQTVPDSPGAILRLINDSLAMKVRYVLERLEEVIGEKVEVLHIIGGGGKNPLLNQSIASCIDRPVTVGPYEATAAGNVLMQWHAAGGPRDLKEGREMIRRSFETESYHPVDGHDWAAAYRRFRDLIR